MRDNEPHPWGEFLRVRKIALKWARDEMNYSNDEIAAAFSMDALQVEMILSAKEYPCDSFCPPPWELSEENEQKTEGWLERQRWERKQKEEGGL